MRGSRVLRARCLPRELFAVQWHSECSNESLCDLLEVASPVEPGFDFGSVFVCPNRGLLAEVVLGAVSGEDGAPGVFRERLFLSRDGVRVAVPFGAWVLMDSSGFPWVCPEEEFGERFVLVGFK